MQADKMPLRIDLVSDVVCPWCIIGFKQFEKALVDRAAEIELELHWHPFELNPHMPPEGQDLREHLARSMAPPANRARQRVLV